jgi:8-oxo-dGTP pyrophosphatase MutT (NUDIX family)/phosphohistidine phosphatase SixA
MNAVGRDARSGRREPIKAAGCVVWRDGRDGREVLIVHRPRYDDWSLPKGKCRADEPAPVAAVREVHEETGVLVRLGPEQRSLSYRVDGAPKEVRFWVAESVEHTKFKSNAEVDAIAWVTLAEARERLRSTEVAIAHAGLKGARPSRPLIVVRHALSVRRKDWSAEDPGRPLSRDGKEQSKRLSKLLACWAPTRLVSSPSRRCVDTLAPFADRTGLPIDIEPGLSEEGFHENPKRAKTLIAGLRAEREVILVCTHRPLLVTIADLIGLDLPRSARSNPLPKGALWVAHAGLKDRVERYTS